jgi:predicted TIM-barrel fold metal-dependent hydrolase
LAIADPPGHAGESLAEKVAKLRIVDTDIHNDVTLAQLKPYLARKWHAWLEDGGPAFANRGVAHVGSGRMDDALNEEDGLCAGDPDWVVAQLMTKYRVDLGILGSQPAYGAQRDYRFINALTSAINEHLLDVWVRPHPCFKGSIVVNTADPEEAAREIHRHGDDPGMVQVVVSGLTGVSFGNKLNWPIYRAAVEHGLPMATHPTIDCGNTGPQTGVGWYTSFLEHHTGHSQAMMAQVISLIVEGVFEEFPTLRFALIEGGIAWVPYVAGRLDRLYPALKAEVPYLKRLPSEYLREHFYFSTQPLEEPLEPQHLHQILRMIDAEHRLMFASDYPHWDFDNPLTVLRALSPELRRRVSVDNVVACYGPRLLEPSVK